MKQVHYDESDLENNTKSKSKMNTSASASSTSRSRRTRTDSQSRSKSGSSSMVSQGNLLLRKSATKCFPSIWMVRILFLTCLAASAAILGYFAHNIISNSETHLAVQQYEAIADRALDAALQLTLRKTRGAKSLAAIMSNRFPDAEKWPFVFLEGYEEIANSIITAIDGRAMGFCPLVQPGEQYEYYEPFAYEYFNKTFGPQHGIGVSEIQGEEYVGIYGQTVNMSRFIDRDGRYFDESLGMYVNTSKYTYLSPMVQHTNGNGSSVVMRNIRNDRGRGPTLDRMFDCFYRNRGNSTTDCGVISSFKVGGDNDPGAFIYQPIAPAHNKSVLTGFIVSSIRWSETLQDIFDDQVSGIDLVVSTANLDMNQSYTYTVHQGQVSLLGEGDDLVDCTFKDYSRSISLTNLAFDDTGGYEYTLTLYPRDAVFDSFRTSNPQVAAFGVGCIIILTSFMFILYDCLVRQNIREKGSLLEAKREFMRYVSHEVRTPLNTVCMGLKLLQEDLHRAFGMDEHGNYIIQKEEQPKEEQPTQKEQEMQPLFSIEQPPSSTQPKPLFSIEQPASSAQPKPLFQIEQPAAPPTPQPLFQIGKPANDASTTTASTASTTTQPLFQLAAPNTDTIGTATPTPAASAPKPLFQLAPPAATIDTSASQDQAATAYDEEQAEVHSSVLQLTEDILTSANSAVGVLNDFLNYDKIETKSMKLDLSVLNIWHELEATLNGFRVPADAKTIELDLSFLDDANSDMEFFHDEERGTSCRTASDLPVSILEKRVIGDEARITQVFRNVLSNALKFTNEGGKITVKATWLPPASKSGKAEDPEETVALSNGTEVTARRMGSIEVSIHDTGAGMTEEQLNQVFAAGVQFNVNVLQKGQGSGLGMYIAREIVAQHGGVLTADSEGIGHGSTFTMQLPLHYIPDDKLPDNLVQKLQVRPSAPTETESDSSKTEDACEKKEPLRILVVDDAVSNRKLLRRMLERRGHVCDEAQDGAEAVQKVLGDGQGEAPYFDTILLDFLMPVMNGPDAVKRLRKGGCDSFVVGITGNVLPEDVAHFKSCGANEVLHKPVDLNALSALWMEYGISGGHAAKADFAV